MCLKSDYLSKPGKQGRRWLKRRFLVEHVEKDEQTTEKMNRRGGARSYYLNLTENRTGGGGEDFWCTGVGRERERAKMFLSLQRCYTSEERKVGRFKSP